MNKKDKIEQVRTWYREGRIKRLGSGCFSVPSEAFVLSIMPRLVMEALKNPTHR